jgi:hypothetical protein
MTHRRHHTRRVITRILSATHIQRRRTSSLVHLNLRQIPRRRHLRNPMRPTKRSRRSMPGSATANPQRLRTTSTQQAPQPRRSSAQGASFRTTQDGSFSRVRKSRNTVLRFHATAARTGASSSAANPGEISGRVLNLRATNFSGQEINQTSTPQHCRNRHEASSQTPDQRSSCHPHSRALQPHQAAPN